MRLLRNHLHVAPIVVDKIGSILLPESLKAAHFDTYRLYRVLQVGPGRITRKGVRIPIECQPGDRVICHSHTTGPIKMEDGTMLITDDQILAVLPKPS